MRTRIWEVMRTCIWKWDARPCTKEASKRYGSGLLCLEHLSKLDEMWQPLRKPVTNLDHTKSLDELGIYKESNHDPRPA